MAEDPLRRPWLPVRIDLPAPLLQLDRHRSQAQNTPGCARGPGKGEPLEPGTCGRGQRLPESEKRGAHTGQNPTDRGKKGCKRHVLTDRNGVVLEVQTGLANQKDDARLESLLEGFKPVADETRKVYCLPSVIQSDKGYG